MFDKNLLYILTILEAVEKVLIYTKSFTNAEEFYKNQDQLQFNATVNLLIAIGEESKKIDGNLKSKSEEVNWKLLAGLRDKISHDYRGIDPEIIWSVVKEDLVILKNVILNILKDTKIEKDLLKEIINSEYYKHLRYLI